MSDNKSSRPAGSMAMVARYLGLAFLIPISAGAGWMVGEYLDKHLQTTYLAMTCLILAIVGSFIQLLRELTRDANKS